MQRPQTPRSSPFLLLTLTFASAWSGCQALGNQPEEWAVVSVSTSTPDTVIYKIDEHYVGKTKGKVPSGVHTIEFCKQAGFLYHSSITKEYELEAGKHYIFKLTGNLWELEGVRVSIENILPLHEETKTID